MLCILLMMGLNSCIREEEDPKVPFELPSNVIHKILPDAYGNIWITTDRGLISFDGDKWNPFPSIPIQNGGTAIDMAIDYGEHPEMWIASSQGVSFFKYNALEILSSGGYVALEGELISNTVSSVAVDDSNGRYFGTQGGLSILKNNEWDMFFGRKNEEILHDYRISSIAVAKNGWIYACTEGGGVSRFTYTDAVSGATTYDSIWSGLRSNYVNTVLITDDTCQWYGTRLGASYHSSPYTKRDWQQYSVENGLISDNVLSIAKDMAGNIWFGTDKGLCRLTGETFTYFTVNDGLADNKVNTIAIAADGSLWIGTDFGISRYKNGVFNNYRAE